MKKFTKVLSVLALSSVMFFATPAIAQDNNRSTAQMADHDDEDDIGKWGLLGLLGLIGLVGLKRKDDHNRDRVTRNS